MAEHGLTPEFAAGYRAMTLGGLDNEFKITAKVIWDGHFSSRIPGKLPAN